MPPQRRTRSAPQLPSQTPPQTSSDFLQAHARHRTVHLLNPTIDRTPALLHTPDSSKLTIHIQHPESRVSVSPYGSAVDWSDRASVDGLNEWRSVVLGYWFGSYGATVVRRSEVVKYCEEEKQWLRKVIGGKRVPSWEGVAEGFSAEFEGVVLDGHREPRPKRTANQLKALYYGMTKKEAETPKAETTEAETLEAETTEPDDSSEMEEWELEIIMRFCEKVRQLREEKRRNVAMERMRRLR